MLARVITSASTIAITKAAVESVLTGEISSHSHKLVLAYPDATQFQLGLAQDADSYQPVMTFTQLGADTASNELDVFVLDESELL